MDIRVEKGFTKERIEKDILEYLKGLAHKCRGDILKMTTLAGSGHPGGSMSSIEMYLTLFFFANVDPKNPRNPDRDRIIISHGHTSPGVYSALGNLGFFDIDKAIAYFRLAGSMFEGHVERYVPGVEWSTGNLGQGLSAGCGMALSARLLKKDFHVFVVMGDGEQQKGQISEARRFAVKYNLSNLTVLIDYNKLQLSGPLSSIMPQNIKENYLSDGWEVIEVDGHDFQDIYQGIRKAISDGKPTAILAHTVMGKGVSFMENKFEFHGRALKIDEYKKALEELGIEDDLEKYRKMREEFKSGEKHVIEIEPVNIDTGEPFTYTPDVKIDNRSSFGKALKNLAELNIGKEGRTPIAVFDCDLVESVRTHEFEKVAPDNFFEGGIQEHNTATIAGALSTQGVLTFFADFGVFGVDETYNQHRLNDINFTNLKVVVTHCGLDVGEDGKTHQCIDYIGLPRNLFGFKIIVPADANQTDRVIRYIAKEKGNFLVAMGRSALPIITDENGNPFFGGDYKFIYGKMDKIRDGDKGAIITMGSMVFRAVQAWEKLKEMGIKVKVFNFSTPKEIDWDSLKEAVDTGLVITYEDHNVHTGIGSIIGNAIAEKGFKVKFIKLGVKEYGASGKPDDLFKLQGLDVNSLVNVIKENI
ncbi:MAG: transketolase [Dictyoglomus sp.]|nr:transketolase [Dictyoglomus sp.]MDW8188214.1 transketolase [Dictyoglomus sp.]